MTEGNVVMGNQPASELLQACDSYISVQRDLIEQLDEQGHQNTIAIAMRAHLDQLEAAAAQESFYRRKYKQDPGE
ncbi:hypothetical protein ACQP2F_16240 [Actinoplanes sp. CA-030573]|uniref:hypothetical protein n=1 Tax=Actinoplanes sp. CA-030573 TaxID=3239898 RepID=UPI003D90EAFA